MAETGRPDVFRRTRRARSSSGITLVADGWSAYRDGSMQGLTGKVPRNLGLTDDVSGPSRARGGSGSRS